MAPMTSKERFVRMFAHQEADRIPIIDSPWDATIERWQREGMPQNVSFEEYFDLDRVANIFIQPAPWDEVETVEETDQYGIYKNIWGTVLRQWKHAASTPEFLHYEITEPDRWEKAKQKLQPSPEWIDWDFLKKNYPRWQKEGYWIQTQLWFGFDIVHSWIVGTERMLVALMEDPDWCRDIFSTLLDFYLKMNDMIWEKGYRFDCVTFPDDLGYKNSQFFSLRTYREVLKPFHKRAVEWAHEKGVKLHLHSCGDVNPFVPEFIEMGVDALNPLEVKAGMDPVQLKKDFGDKLVLHGGINAVLWDKPDEIRAEMERVIPVVKENGGYIFSSDHSVPSTVSLEDFRKITEWAKELGKY
ncbi:MAG: hypothetical protein GXO74_08920 [Calditrichaeota bacterium]|nr:hypothetical protein [Calditrichota bacterium]